MVDPMSPAYATTPTWWFEALAPAATTAVMSAQPNDVLHSLQHALQMLELLASSAPAIITMDGIAVSRSGD